MEQLQRMPHMGAPKTLNSPVLEGLRSWPVEGFAEIRIYYLIQGELLKVVRVLHGKRDINRILESEAAEDDTHH